MRSWLAALLLLLVPAQSADAIPDAAWQHEILLLKFSLATFGHAKYVPTLAAQIEQESYWRSDAVSHAGAMGPSQFMPKTARWVAKRIESCRVLRDFFDFVCAIPAQIWLTKYNLERSPRARECDQFAFALSMYNGGGVRADREAARQAGFDPDLWFGHVEQFNGRHRTTSNFRENREYPRKILFQRQPAYARAGYGGGHQICASG